MPVQDLPDWRTSEVANIFDEVTLWSAPFGRLLLDHVPMIRGATVVDLGFGTGFPLIELAQRFGGGSRVIGVDVWPAGIARTREKIRVLGLDRIEILEASAASIGLADGAADLVTSNLGINNFEDKDQVYREVHRILRPGGHLCLTTNPNGTFAELFDLFAKVLEAMELPGEQAALQNYVRRRSTAADLVKELEDSGFRLSEQVSDQTRMRFVDAVALLNHSLIRIGFRESWEAMIPPARLVEFYDRLCQEMDRIIRQEGEFHMAIPMLYLEMVRV